MTTPVNSQILHLAIWGLIQLALLGVGASGFGLWAHHPDPRERLALPILLCGQVLATSIYPYLLTDNWIFLGIELGIMLPMDQLAGLLSSSPQASICKGFAAVSLWMIGLFVCQRQLKRSWHPILACLATLYTLGGLILNYLQFEASSGEQDSVGHFSGSFLPSLWAIQSTNTINICAYAVLPLITLLILALIKKTANPIKNRISTLPHRRL